MIVAALRGGVARDTRSLVVRVAHAKFVDDRLLEEAEMQIRTIVSQHRRDFTAELECQGCGHVQRHKGYDDAFYHANIIPKVACALCGKSTNDLGVEYRPLTTKYPEGLQV